MKLFKKPFKKLADSSLNFFFNIYQVFLRSHLGYACKFEPTCSHYTKQSFQVHHPVKALALMSWRLLRCQPFGHGGYDPVPLPRKHIHGR